MVEEQTITHQIMEVLAVLVEAVKVLHLQRQVLQILEEQVAVEAMVLIHQQVVVLEVQE